MATNMEQLRQLREAAERRSGSAGQVIEFDVKVRATVSEGKNGGSLLASSIVLEDLGIRLHGFRMNYRNGKLVPFFPGQNLDSDGNRSLDIRVDDDKAPFDLVVLANECERTDPRTGRTYRARKNVQAVCVNGGKLASTIVDKYLTSMEEGGLPMERIADLTESALASEA
ncbi:MAG: hypothetical protein ACYC4F_09585 [Armatimonadota bacterium]